jgi:hypothetical protein
MKIFNTSKENNMIAKLASDITHGNLNEIDLSCPNCSHKMIFSFTRNRPGRFGLFIYCLNCRRLQHFRFSVMPPNFRDDLVLEEFQKLENEAMDFADQEAYKRSIKKKAHVEKE